MNSYLGLTERGSRNRTIVYGTLESVAVLWRLRSYRDIIIIIKKSELPKRTGFVQKFDWFSMMFQDKTTLFSKLFHTCLYKQNKLKIRSCYSPDCPANNSRFRFSLNKNYLGSGWVIHLKTDLIGSGVIKMLNMITLLN